MLTFTVKATFTLIIEINTTVLMGVGKRHAPPGWGFNFCPVHWFRLVSEYLFGVGNQDFEILMTQRFKHLKCGHLLLFSKTD